MRATMMTLVLAGLLAVPSFGAAQGKAAATKASRQRQALLRSLPRGEAFVSGGQKYQLVGGVRAAAMDAQSTERQVLARAGAAPADHLETKGSFVVFRGTAGGAPLAAEAASTLPVAVNQRTGGFGVVLGSITVRLREAAAAEAIAKDHGLALIFAAPHLSTAFFKVPAGQDIQAAAVALAQDARVASAEIEVKEHFAEPQ